MALILLHDELCQDGETCPGLYQRTGRRVAVVRGFVITDPDTLADVAELNAPANEGFLEMPLDVLYDMIRNLRPDVAREVTP